MQFERELSALRTSAAEKLRALQFLLHLVGDLHQPLHAIDDHDAGGNARRVSARGLRAGSLHYYWDVEFVRGLGPDPQRARYYRLPASYVEDATQAVALQLARAGVRLAAVLNRSLQE